MTLAKALNAGLRKAMEDDPKVLIMGEDVGKLGGVFRITDGLQKDFGEDRVIDSPLAESGILGTAVGLAMRGYRPVCEIQFDGFVYPAYDQIVSQVAKIHFRTKGIVKMPIVIRIPFGGGIGAVEHHSESPEAQFAHTPGLKVVACSNPVDGYWMIQQAIACDDPVVFLEPKRQYHADKAELDESATPQPLFTSPRRPPGQRRHPALLRPDGEDLPQGRRGGRGRGPLDRGDRPAHALAAGHGAGVRVRTPHRPRGRRARGARQPRHGLGDRGPDHRAVLLLPRVAGAARRRLRHALPAEPDRGGLPPRPRPGARRRRPHVRVLRSEMPEYLLPDVGEGLTEAEIVTWKVKVGDTIEINDIVVEIETAKSLVELPSPYAGVVGALLVPEGETVPVGTPIIRIGAEAEAAAPAAAAGARRTADLSEMDLSNPAASGGGEGESLVGRNKAERGPERRARKGSASPVDRGRRATPSCRCRARSARAARRPPTCSRPTRSRCRRSRRRPPPSAARATCARWPSRRCASSPRTSASTWPP